jgi:uncharacterized membrane protein YdfJ with MMPL/SSD domain
MAALGRLVVARPWVVVAIWVLALAALAGPAGKLQRDIGNGGYQVPGSQSKLVDRVKGLAAAQQLYAVLRGAPASQPARVRRAQRLANALRHGGLANAVGAVRSVPRGSTVVVPFAVPGSLADAQKDIPQIQRRVRAVAHGEATVLGQAAVWRASTAIAKKDLARAETISIPITLAILLVAFLSAVAAAIPIGLALVGLVVTFGTLDLLSHVLDMSVYVSNTATLLGLGLAIDYSLFIVTRYRELRADGAAVREGVQETLATAGRAIFVSGLTVALGLASLGVLGVGVFGSMAIGAVTAAALAGIGALTLVPAVLCLLGPRIDRLTLRRAARAAEGASLWHRLSDWVLGRRWVVLAGTIVLLLACAAPLLGSRLMFAGTNLLVPSSDPVRQASDAVGRDFGRGALTPIEVAVRGSRVAPVRAALRRDPGIVSVAPEPGGSQGWRLLVAIPRSPAGTTEADDTVRRLRSDFASDPRVAIGGQPAAGVDLIDRVNDRIPWMIAVASALAFVLLLVALRSVVVPLKAVATNLLSVGATLGLVTLLFKDLGGDPGLAWFVPPFLFAIVFGLSMDYEIFLLSRVREEYDRGGSSDAAIRRALVTSGRSITLAAVVIMTVFLASAASRLVIFQQLGVGMAIAVLLDATVVRCGLVPAALGVLGDRNWWLPFRAGRARAVRARERAANPRADVAEPSP